MLTVPDALRQRLRDYDQEHVLHWWDQLNETQRAALLDQVRGLDFELLRQLYARRETTYPLPPAERLAPVPVIRIGEDEEKAVQRGEASLRRGEVAPDSAPSGNGLTGTRTCTSTM